MSYSVFSHDVTAAMLVSQTSPLGVELFSYENAFFCSKIFIDADHVSENTLLGGASSGFLRSQLVIMPKIWDF